MKKFLYILITAALCASCIHPGTTYTGGTANEITCKSITGTNGNNDFQIIEITYNDETHEYVSHDGVSHWAGCKYCKERENETLVKLEEACDKIMTKIENENSGSVYSYKSSLWN